VSEHAPLEELLNTDHEVTWGQCEQLSPLVRRVTANNPSKFTFKGTGTYIIGRGKVAVIDPGPSDDKHIKAVLGAVRGEEITHILVTHTHRDHSPATTALAEATGARTFGFGPHPADPQDYPYAFNTGKIGSEGDGAQLGTDTSQATRKSGGKEAGDTEVATAKSADDTEKSGDTEFTPQETLRHGDIVHGKDWTIECLCTPGHISNHLCFALEQESTLFTGDHIMGWSSTIIPPPHGNLAAYLDSLSLLLARRDTTYYPTHGPSIQKSPKFSPQDFVQAMLGHREQRTAQILHHLKSMPMTIANLVAQMYSDKPKELHQPAAQSVLAHLVFLLETNRIQVFPPENQDDQAHLFALATPC